MQIRTLAVFIGLAVLPAAVAGCGNDLLKADELLATGDFDGAAAIYEKRLAKNAGDGAGTIGLARVRYTKALENAKAGKDTAADWNRAVELLDKAVLVDPAPKDVQPITEDVYADALQRAGMKSLEAKDWAKAAEELEKAVDKGKKTADVYTGLARALAGKGDMDGAIKAGHKAVKKGQENVEFLREAATWAGKVNKPWVYHFFFYKAEERRPSGFLFKKPKHILEGLSRRYGSLNMIHDTLNYFLFNAEAEPDSIPEFTEREPLFADMDKFLDKKPPAGFDPKDRDRLGWVVYHFYNVIGIVWVYIGGNDKARAWFEKAIAIDPKKIKHPNVTKEGLADELTWAEKNLKLIQ